MYQIPDDIAKEYAPESVLLPIGEYLMKVEGHEVKNFGKGDVLILTLEVSEGDNDGASMKAFVNLSPANKLTASFLQSLGIPVRQPFSFNGDLVTSEFPDGTKSGLLTGALVYAKVDQYTSTKDGQLKNGVHYFRSSPSKGGDRLDPISFSDV